MHSSLRLSDLHPGYHSDELQHSPYARFYDAHMGELPSWVREALLTGPLAPEQLPPVQQAAALLHPGYLPVETGYTRCRDGAAHVAVLTDMPDVSPAMWEWWFAWHGCDAQRYKLWHPRAHLHVAWADGRHDEEHYVGRTSLVTEYIGSGRIQVAIHFLAPSALGLDEAALRARGEVAVVARCGLAGSVLDSGWMLHHLRPTANGCEMRSRFWIGGRNAQVRGLGLLGTLAGQTLGFLLRPSAADSAALLVHCAQEMNHLAARLPALYAQFGPRRHTGG